MSDVLHPLVWMDIAAGDNKSSMWRGSKMAFGSGDNRLLRCFRHTRTLLPRLPPTSWKDGRGMEDEAGANKETPGHVRPQAILQLEVSNQESAGYDISY